MQYCNIYQSLFYTTVFVYDKLDFSYIITISFDI